jgi:uncharacterized protein YdeI (YjbR/CyaY-like superfamily)
MPKTDPRIDAYIAKSADFARPILLHLRQVVHEACPEGEETMKWSFPHFTYGGKILASMASFKQHCAFGFWHGAEVVGDDFQGEKAMGSLGRITSLKDLPAKRTLAGYVKKQRALIDAGAKRGVKPVPAGRGALAAREARRAPPAVPEELAAALAMRKHAKARATFDGFSPSHRREYVEWIAEAKRAETREKRVAQALEWLAEGKARNWKYERK